MKTIFIPRQGKKILRLTSWLNLAIHVLINLYLRKFINSSIFNFRKNAIAYWHKEKTVSEYAFLCYLAIGVIISVIMLIDMKKTNETRSDRFLTAKEKKYLANIQADEMKKFKKLSLLEKCKNLEFSKVEFLNSCNWLNRC